MVTEQGARRRRAPDFFARAVDGTGLVVDCRPVERIDERSAQSFAAMLAACEQVVWVYPAGNPCLGICLRCEGSARNLAG